MFEKYFMDNLAACYQTKWENKWKTGGEGTEDMGV